MRSPIPWILRPDYWRELWSTVRLGWQLTLDGRVPIYLKIIPILIAVYVIFPIDFVPGFIPFLGQLDDLAVLTLGLQLFLRLAPDNVIAEYRGEQN